MADTWGARLFGTAGRRLILASASPRRAEILAGFGLEFERRPVAVVETVRAGEDPAAAVERLAREKAAAAEAALREDGALQGDPVIVAADTLVVLDGRALGKPGDDDEAREMLRALSGRAHRVLTGVAVRVPSRSFLVSGVSGTGVRFRDLGEAEIEALVRSGEARDKAGGYGIQGLAGALIDGIEGDYLNVVGLPGTLLRELLLAAAGPR